MFGPLVLLVLAGTQGSTTPDLTALVTATTYNLTMSHARVVGCNITATSGNPKVDQYICESVRICADHPSDSGALESCMAEKRQALAQRIAKSPKWLKY